MNNKQSYKQINSQAIKENMQRFGYDRNKVLASELGVDEPTISAMLKGNKNLTDWHKRTFYYFFKTKELQNKLKNTPQNLEKNKVIDSLISYLEKLKKVL